MEGIKINKDNETKFDKIYHINYHEHFRFHNSILTHKHLDTDMRIKEP